MHIVSPKFLTFAPSHAGVALVGTLALICGLWSIPTTIMYHVAKPCTVTNSTQFITSVLVTDCSTCVEAPSFYLSTTPPCASPQAGVPYCLNGFKCCDTCCDTCVSANGRTFPCNCNCCNTVNQNLCIVYVQNTTTYVWSGPDWNATSSAPPPTDIPLPWDSRCIYTPSFSWIYPEFPVEVWIVPCVIAMMGTGVILVWRWRRMRHSSTLQRRPTIFSTELTIQRPQVRSSLSSALLSIRQEAHNMQTHASSSSADKAMPTPTASSLP